MKKRIVLCIRAVMLLLAACNMTQLDTPATSGSNAQLQEPGKTPETTPSTTNPPATNPPESNPPATNPPATNPPETNPPATNPPATNPPETNPPATNPPETNPPETNPPQTNPSQPQPHIHVWSNWSVKKAATCTSAGSEECVCTGCNEKQTRVISATGHSYGDWKVTKAATCEAKGEESKTCKNCSAKQTQSIPATGHSYGSWKVTKAVAQCLKDHGWLVVSHSYGHPAYGEISAERVDRDSTKWEDTVQPIIGETDILIFPYGSDIHNWKPIPADNEKFNILYEDGYRYFFNVDSNVWNQLGNNHFRGGRLNLDGYVLYHKPQLVAHLFDVETVFDPARPTPVPDK